MNTCDLFFKNPHYTVDVSIWLRRVDGRLEVLLKRRSDKSNLQTIIRKKRFGNDM